MQDDGRGTFRLRALGLPLAALLVAAPLLETLHAADVRHVACPEDGELIDAPVQAAHQHVRGSGDGPQLFSERDPAGPLGTGQEHDHCAIMVQAQLRAREQFRKPFVVQVLELASALPGSQEPPSLRSLALYRLAPKASPPLA
jgi:hypothetical protein